MPAPFPSPLFGALLLAGALGCSQPPPAEAPALADGSAALAEATAKRLLTAAAARDATAVKAALCPSLASHTRDLLDPGQALAIESFTITRVEPTWQGAEPVFHVAVDLVRNGARLPRALRVRAREGCVDQLLDSAPVGSRSRDPGEISL